MFYSSAEFRGNVKSQYVYFGSEVQDTSDPIFWVQSASTFSVGPTCPMGTLRSRAQSVPRFFRRVRSVSRQFGPVEKNRRTLVSAIRVRPVSLMLHGCAVVIRSGQLLCVCVREWTMCMVVCGWWIIASIRAKQSSPRSAVRPSPSALSLCRVALHCRLSVLSVV